MAEWLIVGAGLTGVTLAEHIARLRDEDVTIVERRPHIAGNAYDFVDEAGICVHRYGPHLFHTNSEKVWNYVQAFAEWRPYEHKARAVIDGTEVPLPFNFNSIEAVFPPAQAADLVRRLTEQYPNGQSVPVLTFLKADDPTLKSLANFVYENIFKNYTLKQWGLLPEQLSPSVTARVPIRASRDDRYFQDTYQAMPVRGYTDMVERMLNHPRIHVALNTDSREIGPRFSAARTIHTGSIDEFFDYRFGPLPYRSLDFRVNTLDVEWHQSVGTVNYPNQNDYTRITEFKHLTGQVSDRTTIAVEYPRAHAYGENEPYYPIPRDDNRALHAKYKALAHDQGGVRFCGRLGDYRYYNMDQAIAAAMA